MKRKNGKTRSVGVHPCHGAWRSAPYCVASPHAPGLLTTIIAAIVRPRKTSRERRRGGPHDWLAGAKTVAGPGSVTAQRVARGGRGGRASLSDRGRAGRFSGPPPTESSPLR